MTARRASASLVVTDIRSRGRNAVCAVVRSVRPGSGNDGRAGRSIENKGAKNRMKKKSHGVIKIAVDADASPFTKALRPLLRYLYSWQNDILGVA